MSQTQGTVTFLQANFWNWNIRITHTYIKTTQNNTILASYLKWKYIEVYFKAEWFLGKSTSPFQLLKPIETWKRQSWMNLWENGDGGSVAKIRLVLDSGFNAVHPNTTILYIIIKIVHSSYEKKQNLFIIYAI